MVWARKRINARGWRGEGEIPTGSSVWAETQGAIVASCGGEIVEASFGDKKFAFVPGTKPKDRSETIIAVVKGEN